jgi:type I restriction enzyme S subunit
MREGNGHHGERVIDELRSIRRPLGWTRTSVSDVGDVRLGRQRSPKNRSADYPTKYIRAANITWNGLDLSDVLDMDFRPEERATYRLQPGDVLLSEASGSASEVGKPAIWNGELENCCFQNTVIRFRPTAASSRFALLAFQHFARNSIFARISKGVGIHHLSADRFASMPFLLPPLNEQRRIVTKIEELFSDLDAGVAALERAKANLKRYRAAVLKAAVEGKLTEAWRAEHPDVEPASKLLERILRERRAKWEADQLAKFAAAGKDPPKNWRSKYVEPKPPEATGLPELPETWCWASVEQVAEFTRYGSSAKAGHKADGTPVLRMGNIVDGRIDYADLKYLPSLHPEFPNLLLRTGDLLFNRTNSAELVGKSAVYNGAHDPCSFASYLIAVRCLNGCDTRFLCMYINSLHGRSWVKSVVSQQVGQANVNGTKLQAMLFPFPSIDEQDQIVACTDEKLSLLQSTTMAIEIVLLRAARLRQSILKQAFEGKLVPQDLNDEPASVLLERLQANRSAHEGNGKSAKRPQNRRAKSKQSRRRSDA